MGILATPVSLAANANQLGERGRFEALDGLRGLCAVLVVFFHFQVNSPQALWRFTGNSWLFVDFFFVLSGFVIAVSYRDRLSRGFAMRDFAILRLGRIYPLHFIVLFAFVAIEILGLAMHGSALVAHEPFAGQRNPASIVSNLLLFQSFGLHGDLTWNGPAWSIAAEFWTYLLFAVGIRLLGGRLDWVLAALVVVAPLILLRVTDHAMNVTHDWGILRCAYGFAAGVLTLRLFEARHRLPRRWLALASIVEGGLVAAVAAFVAYAGDGPWSVVAPWLFALCVFVFAHQAGAVSWLLRGWLFATLGLLSYSIYMVHSFVQSRFDDVLKLFGDWLGHELVIEAAFRGGAATRLVGATPLDGALLTPLMLVTVIAVSWLTYRFVEMPGQRLARYLVHRQAAPQIA